MMFLEPIFVLPSLLFWIAAAVILLLIVASSAIGQAGPTTILTLVFLGLLVVDPTHALLPIVNNPGTSISIFLAYFMIGAAYSVAKWRLWMNSSDIADNLKSHYKIYQTQMKGEYEWKLKAQKPALTKEQIDEKLEAWKPEENGADLEGFKNSTYNCLRLSKNKAMIMGWIFLWWVSLIWTLLHDTAEHLYNALGNFYDRIATNKIDKVLK